MSSENSSEQHFYEHVNTNTNRKTMCFYLPISNSVVGYEKNQFVFDEDSIAYSSDNIYTSGSNSKFVIKKMYINPQSITNNAKKIMPKQLTKGGYFVQYWGEDLTTLSINGSTGSAGISEINKLVSIYRHEQIFYDFFIKEKLRGQIEDEKNTLVSAINNPGNKYGNTGWDTAVAIGDFFTSGAVSQVVDGFLTGADYLSRLASGTGPAGINYDSISQETTLGSLASSLVMEFQGVKYRGFIDNFSFTETASEPGLFTYNFNFTVLYSSGTRKNFMSWHIESEKEDGSSSIASVPVQGTVTDKYSFEVSQAPETQGSQNPYSANDPYTQTFVEDPVDQKPVDSDQDFFSSPRPLDR